MLIPAKPQSVAVFCLAAPYPLGYKVSVSEGKSHRSGRSWRQGMR
jgi:hypothetical protein